MKKIRFASHYIQEVIALKNRSYNQLQRRVNLVKVRKNLLKFSPELFFLSQHKEPYVRQSVVEIVKQNVHDSDEKTKKKLLPLLFRGIGDVDCRYEALEGLLNYPEINYTFLIGGILLQDDSPNVRVQASDLLASLQQPEAVPFLEASLNDKDALVRVYSAYGLALLDSKQSIPKLIKLERKDRKMTVKTACWGGLLLLTAERVWLEKMFKVLDYKDYHVPMQAINYISNAVKDHIISMEDVAPHIEKYFRKERREAVSSRMKSFLKGEDA
jgi:hypothetical protein